MPVKNGRQKKRPGTDQVEITTIAITLMSPYASDREETISYTTHTVWGCASTPWTQFPHLDSAYSNTGRHRPIFHSLRATIKKRDQTKYSEEFFWALFTTEGRREREDILNQTSGESDLGELPTWNVEIPTSKY